MIIFQIPDSLKSASASLGLSLTLIDARSQTVCRLFGGHDGSDLYTVQWDGCDQHGYPVGSGVYALKLETPLFSQTQKILVLR